MRAASAAVVLLGLGACARYEPQPLDLTGHPAEYRARRLDDPQLLGVLAVFASGGLLSLGSPVGFVTLFGIATRNAVMLISHYDHLVAAEGALWGRDAAIRGALERLGPILMTALVTALGLLPLALGSGDPGREIEGPMAIVILGGLLNVHRAQPVRAAAARASIRPVRSGGGDRVSALRSGSRRPPDRSPRRRPPATAASPPPRA